MATFNDRLDAIIRTCGGNCQSKLYGDKLETLALAIGKIDLMFPQLLTEEEKAIARQNIGAGTGNIPEAPTDGKQYARKNGAWDEVHSALPAVTAADNDKFLRVVSGAWAAVTVPDANGVSF